MVNPINSALVSTLFGGTSGTGVGADLLAKWASAKAGVGVQTVDPGKDANAPFATVWSPGLTPSADSLQQRALAGKAFFDTGAKLYSDLGATGDYKRLFALHTGISTLQALATRAGDEDLTAGQRKAAEAQFNRGLAEMKAFFGAEKFEDVRLAQGDRVDAAQTTLAIPVTSEDYVTPVIHKGSLADKVLGLDANAKFDVVATSAAGTERRVSIDLAQMGSIPRSLGNVVSFVNNKLSAAGALSRLEAVNQTPKTQKLVVGGKTIETPYTGARQYALKVDVRGNESVAFEPVAAKPAFYVVGQVNGGARLVKLEDVGGAAGQPTWLDRPAATTDPIDANIATGYLGAGAPYGTAPAEAFEKRTNALVSTGANNFEDKLRAAGEANLKLTLADGRTISVTTAWRSDDLEAWRTRAGESEDQAMVDDLAERLTQLLHEQGVAAGVDVWQNDDELGLSIFTADGVSTSSFTVSGTAATLIDGADPAGGMVGGLRAGVAARRFEAANVAGASELFVDKQIFTFTGASATQSITIDGGEDGIDAATLVTKLNAQLRSKGISAAASLVDNAGVLSFRVDALHDIIDVSASINETSYGVDLQAPGAWAVGGLPVAGAGEPYGDAVRTYDVQGGSPLSTYTGALDIAVVVATATGDKTINVSISALERANDPDPSPGEWSAAFQARLDTALNAAGVYVGAQGSDLAQWSLAEGSGQRLKSISINGDALTLTGQQPSAGIGGAFSVERSSTSAQAATGVSDDVAALLGDPNVSITFETAWGNKTISAALEVGDARTLESAALRLNEALSAAGYDVGVAAVDLSGGGAGLRIVSGASHTVRNVSNLTIGGGTVGVTLDPIDSVSHADDPVGAAGVAARATRGAAITETVPATSAYAAPSVNATGWFAGRAFDVSVGGASKAATARAVATGADGSVYVLADLSGDSATLPIKGARDVALLKYDSAGKLAFTRVLGASDTANGYALAVSDEGKVAVAGSVVGALSGGGVAKGGTDSFVTLFDANGAEVWTARRGASANDEARAVAFAPDGSIIVAGKTESALGPALSLGGSDAYVRGYSATGLTLFTKQFGTGSDDAATALMVRDNGSGGAEIFTGGVENSRGVVRSFTYTTNAGLATGATRDIGYFHTGAINTLATDGASLYVGGAVGADRLSLGTPARGAVAGQEGFVARLDAGLVSNALDRATYIGSAQDDSVTGLAIVNGDVYASGAAGGVLAGQGNANSKSGYLTRLDAAGDMAWTRTFSTAGGALTASGLAVDTGGASPLDVLGIPRGRLDAADSSALTQRSALRVGDEFQLGVDGRRLTTITIAANDTLSSLMARINRAAGSAGHAKLIREDGADRISIVAADGRALRLEAGRDGRDALAGLGLGAGVIAKNTAARGALRTFGLGLVDADLKVNDKTAIAKTKSELSAALSIVKQAYEAIANPNAKEQTAEEKALDARKRGAVPEYYTQQLANYQAALSRLGG
ncbi:MAG: hypothetical protein WDM79_17165 [Terricaulis sp.]